MLHLVEGVNFCKNISLWIWIHTRAKSMRTPILLTAISLQQLIDHFIEVLSVRLLHKHGLNMELDFQRLFGPHVT